MLGSSDTRRNGIIHFSLRSNSAIAQHQVDSLCAGIVLDKHGALLPRVPRSRFSVVLRAGNLYFVCLEVLLGHRSTIIENSCVGRSCLGPGNLLLFLQIVNIATARYTNVLLGERRNIVNAARLANSRHASLRSSVKVEVARASPHVRRRTWLLFSDATT